MSERPYFKWFEADYLADTFMLSIEEDCLYRRLLGQQWRLGKLPTEPDKLAELARFPREVFDRAWPRVRPYFRWEKNGLVQKKMASQMRSAKREISRKKDAANSRWNKELHACALKTGVRSDGGLQCYPDPNPYPDPKKEDLRSPPTVPPTENPADPSTPPEASGSRSEKRSPTKLGTRLPEDWEPSPELVAWAQAERPDLDVAKVAAEFVDYWVPLPGARGRKLDWSRTFKNRIRSAPAPRNGVPFREGIEQTAESIGLSARPGESWEQFRHRVERAKR